MCFNRTSFFCHIVPCASPQTLNTISIKKNPYSHMLKNGTVSVHYLALFILHIDIFLPLSDCMEFFIDIYV